MDDDQPIDSRHHGQRSGVRVLDVRQQGLEPLTHAVTTPAAISGYGSRPEAA